MTFLLFFLFFTLRFTVGVNVAFGGQLAIYQDFLTAFLSVFAQQLGDSALGDMQQQRYFVGTLFYFLMAVIGTIVLTNIFIGVVRRAPSHGAQTRFVPFPFLSIFSLSFPFLLSPSFEDYE